MNYIYPIHARDRNDPKLWAGELNKECRDERPLTIKPTAIPSLHTDKHNKTQNDTRWDIFLILFILS